MRKLGLHEVRKEYLDFFREKEHKVIKSFSLVPQDDDSLLLIGAGMAPLKKYFTGEAVPPKKRMASCQKCIRTGDIENVGKTDRHATYFEMLGNFSFGDYFKVEAMRWAWEFLHERLEIPAEDLWVTVFEEDDEAYELWQTEVGLPKEKIVKLGKEDNFWELEVGPSGPCSEIFVDRGEKYGCGCEDCKPGCECDRFIEVWNLVFTQFDKDKEGVYHPLAHPNIDTGMGLERIASVLQGADNIFEIDAIHSILEKIEEIADYKYGTDPKKDESIRVITDHSRAVTFLVSDGVVPGNEGRGYVLRRLTRRALRHGKLLGIEGEFLNKIIEEIIESWKVEYDELESNKDMIMKIVAAEEARFQETIDAGISRLDNYINNMIENKIDTLPGEDVFKLYDTYGFPVDLTREILEEKGLSIDEEGFNLHMQEQRQRARDARKTGNIGWGSQEDKEIYKNYNSEFVGYDCLKTDSNIIAIIKNNQVVEQLQEDEEGIIILDKTPFYGESGGQVGDTGIMISDDFELEVLDTKVGVEGLNIHFVKVLSGTCKNAKVESIVLGERRNAIVRNHSATHLLHKSLKEVLGDHVEQAGSIVLPDRLRFDFTHYEAVSSDDLLKIEQRVNEMIFKSLSSNINETTLEEATNEGVVGLFGDKYGDIVRVVRFGDYSKELCGGVHVNNTSEIGMFKIISESGISSGVRRIEAITGKEVYKYLNENLSKIEKISKTLKSNVDSVEKKAESIILELKEKDNEIYELKNRLAKDISSDILDSQKEINDIKYISYKLDGMDMESMRNLGDELRSKLQSGVVVLASIVDDRVTFLSMVTKDLNKRGILAGNIVKQVAMVTGGNGGGRPDMAQAGGKDVAKVEEALSIVPDIIKDSLK